MWSLLLSSLECGLSRISVSSGYIIQIKLILRMSKYTISTLRNYVICSKSKVPTAIKKCRVLHKKGGVRDRYMPVKSNKK